MLLLVFACLHQPAGSSHLPHISAGSHRPRGSHISAGPHISVGSHRPWGSHHKPWGSHPHHQKFHPIQHEPSHPGYQTNIIIDPYAKAEHKVRITTSDLSTGRQVGHTEWSGPGTLTLSAIGSLARNSGHFLLEQRDGDEDWESIFVQPQHRPSHQHITPPPTILGSACSTHSQCAAARNSVCASNPSCQLPYVGCPPLTCQCPADHQMATNKYQPHRPHLLPTHPTHRGRLRQGPKRKRRSLIYHQECRPVSYRG